MQTDDVIWGLINKGFCSFKAPNRPLTFCKNKYNLTGICSKSMCPLANSRYATVREHRGMIYLYMKTIERSHLPSKLWERVKLSRNYEKALKQINAHLIYWPKYMINKCKQRLTRITQYLIRMRKLKSRKTEKIIPISRRTEKLEKRKELRALNVAQLDTAIEKQLLNRLETGVYGDIYNFPEKEFIEQVVSDTESETEFVADDEIEESETSDVEDVKSIQSEPDLEYEYEVEGLPKGKKIKLLTN
ncbi:Protein MAK16-like [Oopsacas minuta]|uniref:Protein MAK16 homolog n=1 Tax=Oopsacas minuta TaxID=111878 RepID=A0AAV7KL42_9METZ|nr:Protein MAK16-like [Oopsacas minuta]